MGSNFNSLRVESVGTRPAAVASSIPGIKTSKQFLYLGDPDHRDSIASTAFMARDSLMAEFESAGIKHLFIERPSIFQNYSDDLVWRRISPAEFSDLMSANMRQFFLGPSDARTVHNNTANIILNAKKHGITVHFADHDQTLTLSNNSNAELTEIKAKVLDSLLKNIEQNKLVFSTSNDAQIYGEKFAKEYMSKLPQSQVERLHKAIIQERLAFDQINSQLIKNVAGKDKSVVFYGAAHASGFEAVVGQHNVEKVVLFGPSTDQDLRATYPTNQGWHPYEIESNLRPAVTVTPKQKHFSQKPKQAVTPNASPPSKSPSPQQSHF